MLSAHPLRFVVATLVAVVSAADATPNPTWPLLGSPPEAPQFPVSTRQADLAGPAVTAFAVSPTSREESRNFFNTVYAASAGAVPEWTGTYTTCTAGTTASGFREAVARRINFFRAMAGVPAGVTLSPEYDAKAQRAALMMSANTNLNHYPPSAWICYSTDGAEAAGKANLALGVNGPEAIDGYIEDPGIYNFSVGHRRWLLFPQTRVMGSGDVPGDLAHYAANAVWVLDDHFFGLRPTTRDEFVAWPPPGFVPYPVAFPRWSLAYPNANFTNATVTVTRNGLPVATEVEPVSTGAGENSLVWVMTGDSFAPSGSHAPPAADVPYSVRVDGVEIGNAQRSFTYSVTVFDPAVSGADTVQPTITGPVTIQTNQTASYRFTTVPKAEAHEVRFSRSIALNITEGAEDNLVNFDQHVSPGYPVIISHPRYLGSYAIHLTHLNPAEPQILAYRKTILPGANAIITFRSRLGYAAEGQHARVQVSTDYGRSWRTLYSQAGTSTEGETTYQSRSASLAAFAGRSLILRLVYDYTGGGYYSDTLTHVGWLVDELKFVNCSELTSPVLVHVPVGDAFSVTPTAVGAHALEARAWMFGGFPLEWGPAFPVTVQSGPALSIRMSVPKLVAGKLQLDFTTTGATAATQFKLVRRAAVASGSWTEDPAATLVKLGGTSFRFLTTPPASEAYFRVRGQ